MIKSLDEIQSVRDYLSRVGAEARSLKTAVIRENKGQYWTDLATIRFDKDGKIKVSDSAYEPTDTEQAAISRDFGLVQWPEMKRLRRIVNAPKMISEADPKDVFEYRDTNGDILMVQVRFERKGERSYVPWTYWSDDEWRCCEPDGPLPLYNADKLKDAATVVIHEGAKAARRMQLMVEALTADQKKALADHPWGQELLGAVHLGWTGGALSPYRTNWAVVMQMGIKRAYIVADNDEPGRSAVPSIAQQLRIPTFLIQFTDEFPASFDLGDDFPDKLFATNDGFRHYIGPSLRDCLHPATWATDLIPNPRGKPTPVLRDAFKSMWSYVEEADLFVCNEMPEILRSEAILNKMVAPFSHAAETSRLIVKSFKGRSTRICYRPDHKGQMVTFRGSSAINLHVPSQIKAGPGSTAPWLDFMAYMFPNPTEREEVLKWCATLIAKPAIRMAYGLLLVSERQGIGKTTLGSHILAPLVGVNNAGYPNELEITGSMFNDWMANKRLIVVNEIYSGASWKAYHSLKSVITDRDVTVNQKYMRPYTIENWCHVLACSNSLRALKMDSDDRRWFYPEVSEAPWPREKFVTFRAWLDGGGLSVIKRWAEEYGNYVSPSDRSPMTERKKEMIEGSRSEAQKEAAELAEALKSCGNPGALVMKDIVGWVRAQVQGRVFDTDYELRKAAVEVGLIAYKDRIKIAGRVSYIIINDELQLLLNSTDPDNRNEIIRKSVLKPNDLLEGSL